jgi:putative DNA primase/helicase
MILQKLHGWDFAKAAREVDAVVGNVQVQEVKDQQTEADKVSAIKRLMGKATKLGPGVPAWDYLKGRCGITDAPGDLWSHPGLVHPAASGTHPALLAVMRYADGSGSSIHRTFLGRDGWKAQVEPCRMIMPGKPINGSCVRLAPPVIAGRIGIAEGIETALCASELFGMPVWAAISAGGLVSWDPPEFIRSVVIFGDNDATYTGQASAYTLARRLSLAGLEVTVEIPEVKGADWCDVFTTSKPNVVNV